MVLFGGFQIENFFCSIGEVQGDASIGHNSYTENYSRATVKSEIFPLNGQIGTNSHLAQGLSARLSETDCSKVE